MSLTTNTDYPVSAKIKGLSHSLKDSELGDLKFRPSIDLFERFGICGTCVVYTKRGAVRLMHLKKDDKVLTRKNGFVSTFCMMAYSPPEDTTRTPAATFVAKGCLGNGLPQDDLAFGASNLITRYVVTPETNRPKAVSLQLFSTPEQAALKNCNVDELCILVFSQPTEILIQGIYVRSPEIADVTVQPKT